MKTLMTILMLLVSVTAFSQTYILNALEYTETNQLSYDDVVWGEPVEIDVMISLDLDNRIIRVDNVMGNIFYLQDNTNFYREFDADGDLTHVSEWSALDAESLSCDITIIVWDDYSIAQLYVEYSNVVWCWDCEILK